MNAKLFFLPFFLFLLLAVPAGRGRADDPERDSLLEQKSLLEKKVEKLKREQDFLVFEKTVYSLDSKYLVLTLHDKTGQLKYKNRVLRDFHFSTEPGKALRLRQGASALDRKIEGAPKRRGLVFSTFLLKPDGSRVSAPGIPALSCPKRDFRAIFSSIEKGAPAYLLR